MKWSTFNTWGGFWGLDAGTGDEAAVIVGHDGILSQFVENGLFYDLIGTFAEAHGDLWDVLVDAIAAFDIDTAIGEQLDIIGRILKQPRNAYGDTFYRKILKIRGKLVLQSTGTGENILEICRLFIEAEPDPVVLTNSPPYTFKLSVPGTTESDLVTLIPLLREALIGGVSGVVIVILTGGAVWDSANVAVTGGGIWGSANVVVAGQTNWSKVVFI